MAAEPNKKIVVIDDDSSVQEVVRAYLEMDGYHVFVAGTAADGLSLIARIKPGLVVLDLMLPDRSGEDICREIRDRSDLPILMLTAKASEEERVTGLAIGADDYLTKPFSPRELVARVRAMLRRGDRLASAEQAIAGEGSLSLGEVELDVAARLTRRGGEAVHLTTTEFDLARWFLAHPNVVYTREQLLMQVWGYADGSGERTVDSHVQALRHKLGRGFVRTAHGFGYALGGGTS